MIASRRMLTGFVLLLGTALMSLATSAQQAAQNPRIALVIGNATYRDAALATTANDAGLVAQTLQAAGFDVVGARDLDGQSLRTAFRDFLDKASAAGPDMQAFVYLAGRGVQHNGDNYFVPVDAQINRDADVPIDALRISDFAHALAQTPGKARIIVLDAARANPYAAQGSPLAPGLALGDPEPGELIAFNAAPGTLAGDEQGPYGVFGKTLAGAMRQGGVDLVEVFDQTRVTVNQETQGALLPWSASKLTEPYYIFERAADAPPPAVATAVANQPIAGLPADAAYAAALQRDTIRGYEEYLAHYSDFSPSAARARHSRGPARSVFLAAIGQHQHGACVLDLSAPLSQRPARRGRAPASCDDFGGLRAAARFSANDLSGPAAAAARRGLLRGAALLRLRRVRTSAAAPAARILPAILLRRRR